MKRVSFHSATPA